MQVLDELLRLLGVAEVIKVPAFAGAFVCKAISMQHQLLASYWHPLFHAVDL